MAQHNTLTAGIDTAKDKLDVAVHGHDMRLTVANSHAGWRQLAAPLARFGAGRVGIEATGGDARGVTRFLREAGFTVLVLQPLQTKAFARLHLRRAKNNRIDARLIAACTQMIAPTDAGHDPRIDARADQLTFVGQIEEDGVRLKTRMETPQDPRLRRIVQADIRRLQARRDAELRRIAAALRPARPGRTRPVRR